MKQFKEMKSQKCFMSCGRVKNSIINIFISMFIELQVR